MACWEVDIVVMNVLAQWVFEVGLVLQLCVCLLLCRLVREKFNHLPRKQENHIASTLSSAYMQTFCLSTVVFANQVSFLGDFMFSASKLALGKGQYVHCIWQSVRSTLLSACTSHLLRLFLKRNKVYIYTLLHIELLLEECCRRFFDWVQSE